MPAADPHQLKLVKDKIRSGFSQLRSWWFSGPHRDPENGWIQVFESANYHCVYCGKNLSHSIEDLVASTTDHIVPQHLFPTRKGKDGDPTPNYMGNLVPCCSVCNSLKGSWAPTSPGDPAWRTRKSFISSARQHIKKRRSDREKEWQIHIGKAKIVIWNESDHPDFVS